MRLAFGKLHNKLGICAAVGLALAIVPQAPSQPDQPGVNLVSTLRGPEQCVRALSFSPKGDHVAFWGPGKSIQICEIATGKPKHTLAVEGVTEIAYDSAGRYLAVGFVNHEKAGVPGEIKVFKIGTNELLLVTNRHNPVPSRLTFKPGSELLACLCGDGRLRYWDVRSGQITQVIPDVDKMIRAYCFGVDGHLLAFATDTHVHIHDLRERKDVAAISSSGMEIRQMSFARRQNSTVLAVIGTRVYKAVVWDPSTSTWGRVLRVAGQVRILDPATCQPLSTINIDGADRFKACPTSSIVVVPTQDEVIVWDLDKDVRVGVIAYQMSPAFAPAVSLSNAGDLIGIAGRADGTVDLWKITRGR